jgi:hypothetical protein
MRVRIAAILVLLSSPLGNAQSQQMPAPPQAWTGMLSADHCAASHREAAAKEGLTDRQRIVACIQALGHYVLVDGQNRAIEIANQDLPGFPLYAGRPVRLLGEMRDGKIIATRVEAIAAHLHLNHLLTNWRDTPQNVGFLIAALSEAGVASVHAKLAEGGSLAVMQLHAGHVLNALDPSVEPKGPGAGYGVKKAVAGARQHLEIATGSEGVTPNIKTHAEHVAAALTNVARWTDESIALAIDIRRATEGADATRVLSRLIGLTTAISEGVDANKDGQVGWQAGEGGLQQAQAHMRLMMKGEGLEYAPR